MTTTSATIRAAGNYLARGWAPTPVEARSKRPLLASWPRRRLGSSDLGLFAERNLGLVLGEASGGPVDVDCDWPEAAELAPGLLPATALVHGRASSHHCHWWYCSRGAQSAVFALDAATTRKRVIVELRSSGLMTVVPPSVHPGGERLVWERWGAPAPVSADELHRAVARLALAAVLRSRGWSASQAVSLVCQPASQAAQAAEHVLGPLLPVRTWLGLEERVVQRREGVGSAGGQLVLGRGSSLTEAILLRVGGVVGAARLLGLSLREGRQACPFHGGESRRSLQVTRHAWRCWSGCGQGNSVHFVARALSVDYRKARTWLACELDLRSRHQALPVRR